MHLLTSSGAAKALGMHRNTFNAAVKGPNPPPFVSMGTSRRWYILADLLDWAAAKGKE